MRARLSSSDDVRSVRHSEVGKKRGTATPVVAEKGIVAIAVLPVTGRGAAACLPVVRFELQGPATSQ